VKTILSKTYKEIFAVSNIWICPECNFAQKWTYHDLVERGTPVCPNCDIDMEAPPEKNINKKLL
jgi:rubrerythrin